MNRDLRNHENNTSKLEFKTDLKDIKSGWKKRLILSKYDKPFSP